MINFTVGPVQSAECVKRIGAEDVPYFRTPEFSAIMLENERLIKKFSCAPEGARVAFITGSGTASMEAAVMNCFTSDDLVMVVNGGSFGQRFVDLVKLHNIPYIEVKMEYGQAATREMLETAYREGVTGFLINMHETSTGVLYDMDMVGAFCKQNGLFLVVDAISAFLADSFDMQAVGADIMIAGSQKAIACPPGVSVIVLSPEAVERVNNAKAKCLYLDLKNALKNGERGQTPFTPAVGTLLQMHARLQEIDASGGVESEIKRTKLLAEDFRARIRDLPFRIPTHSLSNAVTPIYPLSVSAYDIFTVLKDEYGIWVCPNGGELAEKIFRVGHIGNLTVDENMQLVNALNDMNKRGLLTAVTTSEE